MINDPYSVLAEFYDVVSLAHWRGLGPKLKAILHELGDPGGPVIDIGAGTGLSTAVIAEALPGAEILAIEPSPSMRAVLISRLVSQEALAKRVTVLPTDLAGAPLPESLGGAVAVSMIGHLSPAERQALWRDLAQRLGQSGWAVIEVPMPVTPTEIPNSRITETVIGRMTYECWCSAAPTGEDTMRWTMTYRAVEGGKTHYERQFITDWWTVSAGRLMEEAASAGLSASMRDGSFLALRPTAQAE